MEAFFVLELLPRSFQLARVLGDEVGQIERDNPNATLRPDLGAALRASSFLLQNTRVANEHATRWDIPGWH